ncbi:ABC transporter permease [Streptococcus anginosus]|uniref:ABC transporter permease n=1 Tax=Streptococcus anginosus TaxID=1328 RepID=UPI0019598612|nr:FtsX-like permease family protein [Streptococcus anginosus]VTY24030.1 MacB-like periplasmic core domain protein [Streptococcus anginosus]
MQIAKQALNYISRKKVKTVLIFLILTFISTALSSSFSIMKTTDNIEKRIYDASNTGFAITSKNIENPISLRTAEKLLENKEISKHNLKYDALATLTNKTVVKKRQGVTRDNQNPILNNLVAALGTNNSQLETTFVSGVFKLEKGKHLQKSDRSKVLIHEKLATQNHLKVGDKFKLQGVSLRDGDAKNGNEIEVEVAGIFSGKKEEKQTGLSSDATENTLYLDYETSQRLAGYKATDYQVTSAVYYVANPKNIDQVVTAVKKAPIDWSKLDLVKNTKAFETISSSITSFKQIVRVLTFSIIIGSIIILALILMFWLRERVYEIGVLLSLGISKAMIMSQFVLELVIISMFSMVLSTISGSYLATMVFKGFIKKGQDGADSAALFENVVPHLDFATIGVTYGILLIIILFAVVGSSSIILHKKPKEILTDIS